MRRVHLMIGAACMASGSWAACAQQATLPAVQVNASRLEMPPLDVPAALSVVKVSPSDVGNPGINLSETLVGVPGILARDRQNYAQDEQISIRGFGSRSTFGVRSIRLYVDGIPATLPDGQGQVSHFDFDVADRVEVLRGPFSVLYGNAAGGVVQLWSAPGTATPQTTLGVYAGSNDSFRYLADTRGTVGAMDYNVAASQFLSGGYRDHSRVNRQTAHARLGFDLGHGQTLTLVMNHLDQPVAQDPMGLTKAQLLADPRQASPAAEQFDTRKSTRQDQVGLIYERPSGDDGQWRAMVYYGEREITQYQSIPVATQANPLQPGGVVQPDTHYGGADLRWTHRGDWLGGDYEFVLGGGGDYQRQHRLGYENFVGDTLGVKGALRRDEDDNVNNVDAYAQWYWHFEPAWALMLGLRHDDVRFSEHDFYVTPSNPNDSGDVNYAATTPVAALQWRPGDDLRLYASYGEGFETPSYNELGYRSDGQPGLALDLRPARSHTVELGAKWQATQMLAFNAALFRANTRDELAIDTSVNGRTTYRNVPEARRQGIELSMDGDIAPSWHLVAGYTHLQAQFRSGFLTCIATPCVAPNVPVRAGSRMPGVPEDYGSLLLRHGGDARWSQGITLTGAGPTTANDFGTARAAGYVAADADVTYTFPLGQSARMQLSARVNNFADHRYVGSVIVNDGNGRYYEPAPGRTWMLGARFVF
ncbi:TonB-dependent receptor [Dyella kyungheensis]|uniref:TonB-dependent receptor n=1 Tax=Dyella kyungheensis TaxID=1242174 RepID=A0ABS2JXJ7_9GAMM|nr:TonB-dependent receptor [Dyella kyungheensis]MBM7123055.1 TonB-dependent receptor [Dyella kyungheensis]